MSNSTEMVRRVATAMQASKAWPVVFDAGSAQELARAAIEAMREPTQWMEIAGGTKAEEMLFNDDPEYTGVIFTDMGVVYRAMIDQAISPDPALSPEDEGSQSK